MSKLGGESESLSLSMSDNGDPMVDRAPFSLRRSISPPSMTSRRKSIVSPFDYQPNDQASIAKASSHISELAAIEAGKATVTDHLAYFSQHLSLVVRLTSDQIMPRLSISDYTSLYQRNSHRHGHHFVIHQHNHPIAGCHYDLRLQFSASSSCSFAIPYGVPGDPNSRRQGRMAIETRVHTLWNNLIESASHATGSLLIWDTGVYEVLPRKMARKQSSSTDDDGSDFANSSVTNYDARPENEKLVDAYKAKYIRLRLHGTRLPKGYTITLRLPSANDFVKHSKPMQRKRKQWRPQIHEWDTDPEDEHTNSIANADVGLASDHEDEVATIRANNAYTGAENTIGSVHQRHWFITLDRTNSGFLKNGAEWIRRDVNNGFDAFFVYGADVETSIVTGRTSSEIMIDEGVENFVARKRWRPVLE